MNDSTLARRLPTSPHDRSCSAIVRNRQILMVYQLHRGETFWTFPGGGIESGESPEQAAVREAREETGLEIEVSGLLYKSPRKSGEGIYYCYRGLIRGGDLALGDDPELSQLRWFPLAEVAEHSEVRCIMSQLCDEK